MGVRGGRAKTRKRATSSSSLMATHGAWVIWRHAVGRVFEYEQVGAPAGAAVGRGWQHRRGSGRVCWVGMVPSSIKCSARRAQSRLRNCDPAPAEAEINFSLRYRVPGPGTVLYRVPGYG